MTATTNHGLKSPTCLDCARERGLVGVTPYMTVNKDKCANCGKVTTVSTAWDWKLPGESRREWD